MALGPGYQPAGQATEIATPAMVNASPLWNADGRLLLSAGAPGGMRLYQMTPGAGGVSTPATNVVTNGGLALNTKTGRLIYTSREMIENLFQISVGGSGTSSQAPERLTSTTGDDFLPRYSPDGQVVAFSSRRFGQSGIWTIQTQGTLSAELVSSPQGTMAPGDWAPDSKSLVFFSTMNQGRWQLYRVAADTGKVTRLTNDSVDNIFPTYSRDGKWIYFSSSREGRLQLYKMPSSGGAATLVVPRAVGAAQESPDGRWLFFTDWPDGGLYRMPIGGGDITRLIDHSPTGPSYVPVTRGVYHWGGRLSQRELRYLDFETRRDELVFQPPLPATANLTMSPDGRRLCFPMVERNSQELMMIENWR
jgi:Tol biopolymer transport system component